MDSLDTAENPFALDATDPDAVPLPAAAEQRVALKLLARMNGDYPAVTVLLALLWRSADRMAVRISSRTLSACCGLGHQVVQRAMQRLERRALVTATKLPRATAAYRVNVPVLRQLLGSPQPEVEFLPGFTPIPALSRLHDAQEQGDVTSSPPREGATHGLP